MSGFSLGDLISGNQKGELSSLFSTKSDKLAPAYDYSKVPARTEVTEERRKVDEDDEEGERQRLRKLKKIEKKKRKALENEAAKESALTDRSKKRKLNAESSNVDMVTESGTTPRHLEAIRREDEHFKLLDPEKEKRTIFVGNLPSSLKEKEIKKMFQEFGKVESVRFRSAARPDLKTTKKVAVIKQTFHDERKNINAYVRFTTEEDAVKSCSLNSTKIQGHSIRVDMSLNSKVHEQNKAIFVGNLDFKTHEDDLRAAFVRCGEIMDVRLVRDSATGIGKGFGYVNFASKDSVETALRLDGNMVCGRKIRVNRSVRKPKTSMLTPSANNRPSKMDESKVTFSKKFAEKKSKLMTKSRPEGEKREKREKKEKGKAFQGVTTGTTVKKDKLSKLDLKKKYIAKALAS